MNRKVAALIGYVICMTISVLAGLIVFPESAGLASFAFFVGLASMFTYLSLLKIEASPPQKGIVTHLGAFNGEVLDAGWHLLPGNPFVFNFIPIDATKVPLTFNIRVNTPDSVPLDMEVNIVFKFDASPEENKRAKTYAYREFLNSGGKDGVTEIIKDIVHERIREWSTSKNEGPQTWEDARTARSEAIAVLVKAILGDNLEHVDDEIPTSTLLRYYAKPQQAPAYIAEEKKWGPDWSKLKAAISLRSPAEQKALEDRVEERRGVIAKVLRGEGLSKPSLGVIICRLGLGDIKPPADIEKAASLETVEKKKMAAESVQLDVMNKRVEDLIKLGLSPTEARDTFHVERGKVKREIKQTVEDNRFSVSPETIKVIGEVVGPIIEAFRKKGD